MLYPRTQDNDPLATLVGFVDSCNLLSLEKACIFALSAGPYAKRAEYMHGLGVQMLRAINEVIKPVLNA